MTQRIFAHETKRRVGAPLPFDEHVAASLGARPPLTALTLRAFPAELLKRRERFLRAVGWLTDDRAEYEFGGTPVLPADATLEDQLAMLSVARTARAYSVDDATLAASLGVAVVGVAPSSLDTRPWDDYFDALADERAPGWRLCARPANDSRPALEAVSLTADTMFGRRRARTAWPVARAIVECAASIKRRWLR